MVTNPRLERAAPDERRTHIMNVARDVFLADGFGASSMSTIAARVGGSKATLYKYFPSKERLFEEMMAHNCDVILASLREAAEDGRDVETMLVAIGERYLRALLAPEAIRLNRLVQAEGFRFPDVAATFFRLGPDRSYEQLAERLSDHASRGAIHCPDPRRSAAHFFWIVRGDYLIRAVSGAGAVPGDDDISAHVAFAARAMSDSLRLR